MSFIPGAWLCVTGTRYDVRDTLTQCSHRHHYQLDPVTQLIAHLCLGLLRILNCQLTKMLTSLCFTANLGIPDLLKDGPMSASEIARASGDLLIILYMLTESQCNLKLILGFRVWVETCALPYLSR